MARSVPSYFLLSALALALPAWGAAAKPAAATSCGADGSAAISSDINYAAINAQLLQADAMQRLVGLQAEIRKLDVARAPEAGLVRHRLLYALAQTQAALGMNAAAISSLKRLPVTSPQAPEALVLLAELEVASGNSRAAVRWLRKMADLYPEEDITVRALWRAAELNHPSSRQAIALWRQAADHADQALASAQAEARRQLQCMTASQGATLRRMEQGDRMVATLNSKLGDSRSTMHNLLQQRLEAAVQDWEALSAEAHFRLADAQEPRIHPGLRPVK